MKVQIVVWSNELVDPEEFYCFEEMMSELSKITGFTRTQKDPNTSIFDVPEDKAFSFLNFVLGSTIYEAAQGNGEH